MKRYIRSSRNAVQLDSRTLDEIEQGLYKLIRQYFHDGTHSHTRGVRISQSDYDLLRYTARPYSGYRDTSAGPEMNEDREKINQFRSELRKYLKGFGVTKVRCATSKKKVHYGYVSGPDDFPVVILDAIYFE